MVSVRFGIGAVLVAGCASPPGAVSSDGRGADGARDADTIDAVCPTGCGTGCCAQGETCIAGTCVRTDGTCATTDDCWNDTCCVDGTCVAWGSAACGDFDAACTRARPSAIVPRCRFDLPWPDPGANSGPFVADIDLDGVAEAVLVQGTDLTTPGFHTLWAIRGDTCEPVLEVPEAGFNGRPPLVANLDEDPELEIVTLAPSTEEACPDEPEGAAPPVRFRVYNHDGTVRAEDPSCNQRMGGDFASAQLDGQGFPEILAGLRVLRVDDDGLLEVVWSRSEEVAGYSPTSDWPSPVVADVDLDGVPEVVTTRGIYDGPTGAVERDFAIDEGEWGYGHVAVADFDATTPEPELVITRAGEGDTLGGTIRIQTVDGDVLAGPYATTPGGEPGGGGPPTVADVDGDGEMEVVTSYCSTGTPFDDETLRVLDLECLAEPLPDVCMEPGFRWSRPAATTGCGFPVVPAFDFDGDGAAEVVVQHRCFLRIHDGRTGEPLAVASHPASLGRLVPAPVDVDGDGAAEIVSVSRTEGSCDGVDADSGTPFDPSAYSSALIVYEDPGGAWMPARPIWNQHSYHVTNVLDDGAVPLVETPSWETVNTYYAQQALPAGAPPDLTVGAAAEIDTRGRCPESAILAVTVWNRGGGAAPAGIAVSFYEGSPSDSGERICTVPTTASLAPGAGEAVSCEWLDPSREEGAAVHAVVDRDEAGFGHVGECHEGNNVAILPNAGCGGPL